MQTAVKPPSAPIQVLKFAPAISGNKIVWWDYRNGNFDIYLYDLDTGLETPICIDPGDQYLSRDLREQDRVVGSIAMEVSDIYLYDLDTVCRNSHLYRLQ